MKVLLWFLILLCVVAVFGAVFLLAGGRELFNECTREIYYRDPPLRPKLRYYV